jgi:hypothetical protein
VGISLLDVYPLYKKEVYESNNDYSRDRYVTSSKTDTSLVAGATSYASKASFPPIKPGSVVFSTDDGLIPPTTFFYRDEPVILPQNQSDISVVGRIVGSSSAVPTLVSGEINYATGEFILNFDVPTPSPVSLSYEHIDEEWPYHAARIDVEVRLNIAPAPIPLVDLDFSNGLLRRLEEVRPIHVLLRCFTLAAELADTVDPTATDEVFPCRHAWYMFMGTAFHYFLDVGPFVDDGALLVDIETEKRLELVDRVGIVSVLDHAILDAGGTLYYV